MANIATEALWWSGQAPDDWKNANVTPIFKEGKKRILVVTSLISVPRKVIEQIS